MREIERPRPDLSVIAALLRSDPAQAIQTIEERLASVHDEAEACSLHAMSVVAYIRTNRVVDAARNAACAVRLAARCDEPTSEVEARLALAQVMEAIGLRSLVLTELADAPRVTIAPALRMRLQTSFASALRGLGRVSEAAAIFDELLTNPPEQPTLAQTIRLNAASTYWQAGRPDDALRTLDEVRAALDAHPDPHLEAWMYAVRAWVRRVLGDPAAALADSRAALGIAEQDHALRSSALRALLDPPIAEGPERTRTVAAAHELLAAAEATSRLSVAADIAQALALEAADRGDVEAEAALLRRLRTLDHRRAEEAEQLLTASTGARAIVLAARAESDALRATSAALAEANERLRALIASRARLVRALAHDLRGPLTAIRLGLDLIRDPVDPRLLADLRAASQQLEAMLGTALADASLYPESPQSAPPVRVDRILAGVLASHRLPAAKRDVALREDIPAGLSAALPADALRRIAHNLISNAIKFTAPGTGVDLRARITDDTLTLTVEDHGPGFGEESPRRLLLDGARGLHRAPVEGHGLGLHTTYRLATGCGGTIDLENRSEGGARVTVVLPTTA